MKNVLLLGGLFAGLLVNGCSTNFEYACQCAINGADQPVILACQSDDDAEAAIQEALEKCQANGDTCVCACVKNDKEC